MAITAGLLGLGDTSIRSLKEAPLKRA